MVKQQEISKNNRLNFLEQQEQTATLKTKTVLDKIACL